jgi:hypothetical protein
MADERPSYPYTFSDSDFVYGAADNKTANGEARPGLQIGGASACRQP